jgi:hypothetical protein
MKQTILDAKGNQNETDTPAIIENLVYEIENHLQLISTKAHLPQTSQRDVRYALDAAENIEKLLGEVREHFLVPRWTSTLWFLSRPFVGAFDSIGPARIDVVKIDEENIAQQITPRKRHGHSGQPMSADLRGWPLHRSIAAICLAVPSLCPTGAASQGGVDLAVLSWKKERPPW